MPGKKKSGLTATGNAQPENTEKEIFEVTTEIIDGVSNILVVHEDTPRFQLYDKATKQAIRNVYDALNTPDTKFEFNAKTFFKDSTGKTYTLMSPYMLSINGNRIVADSVRNFIQFVRVNVPGIDVPTNKKASKSENIVGIRTLDAPVKIYGKVYQIAEDPSHGKPYPTIYRKGWL